MQAKVQNQRLLHLYIIVCRPAGRKRGGGGGGVYYRLVSVVVSPQSTRFPPLPTDQAHISSRGKQGISTHVNIDIHACIYFSFFIAKKISEMHDITMKCVFNN
jgi:hypothetical protein